MDCSTTRRHFSFRLDRRLGAEEESDLSLHLVACAACAATWRSYSSLFLALQDLGEPESPRPFIRPVEAPGQRPGRLAAPSTARPRFLTFSSRQGWAAAALLLICTHLAVFVIATRQPDKAQASSASWLPDAVAAPPEMVATTAVGLPIRQRVRDHLDATELLSREIAYMPANAGRAGMDLISSQLTVLDPTDLLIEVERSGSALGQASAATQHALQRFRGLSIQIRADQSRLEGSPHVAAQLQNLLESSALSEALVVARRTLATEAQGQFFRDQDWSPRLRIATASAEPEVQQFLQAKWTLLSGQYQDASQEFRVLRMSAPSSGLYQLAVYMEAEAYWRKGDYANAIDVFRSFDSKGIKNLRICLGDPLFTTRISGTLPEMLELNGGVVLRIFDNPRQRGRLRLEVVRSAGDDTESREVIEVPVLPEVCFPDFLSGGLFPAILNLPRR